MKIIITVLLITCFSVTAQQVCKTESEIPSTTPDSRFIDYANGTIADVGTGLMWQKCQLGLSGVNCDVGNVITYTWHQALDEGEQNSLNNYNNWRLPNIKELESIVEKRCYNPAININYFPNTSSLIFWSSTPDASADYRISQMIFSSGVTFNGESQNSSRYVRLVRFNQ